MQKNQRKILIDYNQPAAVAQSDFLAKCRELETKIGKDLAYLPLSTYIIRKAPDDLLNTIDFQKEEAKLCSICSELGYYVKHIKNYKLGLVLTFPVTIMDSLYNFDRANGDSNG